MPNQKACMVELHAFLMASEVLKGSRVFLGLEGVGCHRILG